MKRQLVLLLATLICISLCACGGSESTNGSNANIQTESNNGTNTNSKTEKEVEITVDNWQEYFEIKREVNVHRDAFDEITSVGISEHFTIKEEFKDKIVSCDIAIRLFGSQCEQYMVKYDINTNVTETSLVDNPDKIFNGLDYSELTCEETIEMGMESITNGFPLSLNRLDYTDEIGEDNIAYIEILSFENIEAIKAQGTITIME